MERSKFYQFFPPPLFLQMPALGLDISDATIRFVELIETRKGFHVGRYGQQSIPRGIIESGEIKKVSDFRAILSELRVKHGIEYVAVCLPEEKTYLFTATLPRMKKSEIRGALELGLEEYIPLKAQDAMFDYEIEKETETSLLVNVSAAPRALLDGYLSAFEGSGVTPVSFEIEAFSIARSVIPSDEQGAFMIVDFGKTRTGISVVVDGVVKFTSTIILGGDSLTVAISKHLNVPYEDAEKIKKGRVAIDPNLRDQFSLALMSTLSVLRDEVNKSFLYWQNRVDEHGKQNQPIKKIVVCGGDSNLEGFIRDFEQGLYAPVELAKVFTNVNTLDAYIPEINFHDSLSYATAIGLALRRPQ